MPAYVHGRNAYFDLTDINAASFIGHTDLTSISHSWTRDNPQTTTFGKDTQQRISGVRDFSITGAYIYNADHAGASSLAQIMDALLAGSANSVVRYAPGGSITGCPLYTACMLVSQNDHSATISGVVAGTFTMQISSGSVTTGSCV